MNKFVKIFAASAVIAISMNAQAADVQVPSKHEYVQDSRGFVVKSTTDSCWHTGRWTPADAIPGCDGAIAKAEAPKAEAPKAATTAPATAPAAPTTEKVTFSADTLFDFNKATLKQEGKDALDDLFNKLFTMKLEVIVATGHTDTLGTEKYNEKLSQKRAEAVKAYLMDKGVEENRIYVEGKGESSPKVTCTEKNRAARIKCEAPNRRVEIEVVGTRTTK